MNFFLKNKGFSTACKLSKMSEIEIQSDDDGWVFDSLVNFLHGPIWKLPVVGFIEEKSVVFDPDSYKNMTDDKEEEYRKIHEEYKTLVDYMLTSFMEDLQVSAEQVEEACQIRGETFHRSHQESLLTKVALEQLWAAEDFNTFRRLMTRKNIDLQLQSLELLVAKYGVLSPSLRSSDSVPSDGDNSEEDFLQVVISQILEQERHAAALTESEGEEEGEESSPVSGDEVHRSSGASHKRDEVTVAEIASVAPEQHRMLTSVRKALEVQDDELSPDPSTISEMPMVGTEEEIGRRREYLRSQRDKLVALKKKERQKQLSNNETAGGTGQPSRPKSARAAKLAMTSVDIPTSGTNEKALAARRALADRLKQELIQ